MKDVLTEFQRPVSTRMLKLKELQNRWELKLPKFLITVDINIVTVVAMVMWLVNCSKTEYCMIGSSSKNFINYKYLAIIKWGWA